MEAVNFLQERNLKSEDVSERNLQFYAPPDRPWAKTYPQFLRGLSVREILAYIEDKRFPEQISLCYECSGQNAIHYTRKSRREHEASTNHTFITILKVETEVIRDLKHVKVNIDEKEIEHYNAQNREEEPLFPVNRS